jgi:hypothetical protein
MIISKKRLTTSNRLKQNTKVMQTTTAGRGFMTAKPQAVYSSLIPHPSSLSPILLPLP